MRYAVFVERMAIPKAILFFNLTPVGLVSAYFYRLCGWSVSYFRISPGLSASKWLNSRERLGMHGLAYSEIPSADINAFFKRYSLDFARLFEERLRLPELEAAINEHFGLDDRAAERAWSGLRQRLQVRWFEFALIGDYLGRRFGAGGCAMRGPAIGIAREVLSVLPLQPRYLSAGLLEYLQMVAVAIAALAGRLRRRWQRRAALPDSAEGGDTMRCPPDPAQFEVIYFPHKGVSYGELFVKNQFYATIDGNPFHPTRILHLAASTADAPSPESLRYYTEHGLPFASLESIAPTGFRWELTTLLRFVKVVWRGYAFLLTRLGHHGGYRLAAYYFAFRMLRRFGEAIATMPRVRVALVGYDILFSPWLSAALASAGVRTVATQERFILPFYGHLDMFVDRYLVHGARIREEMERRPVSFSRKELKIVGPPRVDDIKAWEGKPAPDGKYERLKQRYFLILALDYHTTKSWDQDRMARAATWSAVRGFYEDMLRLAMTFPTAYVVIKGKDLSNLENPQLADVVARIAHQANIHIETELNKYLPAYMAAVADLGIALHTSLGDEMLASGKACLFYDRIDFLGSLYDYDGFPVVVRSFDEMAMRVGKMIDGGIGGFMDKADFDAMRLRLYGQDGRPSRQRIQAELAELYACASERRLAN